jgi:hypothetical protein
VNKLGRRKFIQLTTAAAAGCFVGVTPAAVADEPAKLAETDPQAVALGYVADSSTVADAARPQAVPNQHCANCSLLQGNDGDEWRPCQIFPGKVVSANGWCRVWAPKA